MQYVTKWNRCEQLNFHRAVSQFVATYHAKVLFLVTASWMLYRCFSFLVAASNFVIWIQNFCHWYKFHTLFISLWWIEFRSVDLYLYLFQHLNFYYRSDSFCFSNLKLSFALVFLFFFLVFVFLDKILC